MFHRINQDTFTSVERLCTVKLVFIVHVLGALISVLFTSVAWRRRAIALRQWRGDVHRLRSTGIGPHFKQMLCTTKL